MYGQKSIDLQIDSLLTNEQSRINLKRKAHKTTVIVFSSLYDEMQRKGEGFGLIRYLYANLQI